MYSFGAGDSSEEHSNAASEEEEAAAAEEEEVAYREPTMYDHLLKTLSGSKSFAKAYKKRWYFYFLKVNFDLFSGFSVKFIICCVSYL